MKSCPRLEAGAVDLDEQRRRQPREIRARRAGAPQELAWLERVGLTVDGEDHALARTQPRRGGCHLERRDRQADSAEAGNGDLAALRPSRLDDALPGINELRLHAGDGGRSSPALVSTLDHLDGDGQAVQAPVQHAREVEPGLPPFGDVVLVEPDQGAGREVRKAGPPMPQRHRLGREGEDLAARRQVLEDRGLLVPVRSPAAHHGDTPSAAVAGRILMAPGENQLVVVLGSAERHCSRRAHVELPLDEGDRPLVVGRERHERLGEALR